MSIKIVNEEGIGSNRRFRVNHILKLTKGAAPKPAKGFKGAPPVFANW
jgi:hypothetical protein